MKDPPDHEQIPMASARTVYAREASLPRGGENGLRSFVAGRSSPEKGCPHAPGQWRVGTAGRGWPVFRAVSVHPQEGLHLLDEFAGIDQSEGFGVRLRARARG